MTLPVRPAVLNSPDYPFSPVDAPIKLDQNESFADFPDRLKAIALERLRHLPWHRYTDLHAESLSEAIAAHDGWSASGTVVTTGSNVLIALLIQLCALGGRVVTVTPNFALYALDARLLGASLTEVPLRDDASLDMDAVIASLGASQSDGPHGVIYIPRPHAPTGSLCALDELERLAQACPGWLLVVDEAYHHFAPDDARELARRHDHVVLLRTLSKAWGLAGLRLGYALASDSVARQLRKLVPPFGVSLMQSVCAQVALEHAGYVRERVATTLQERERMATRSRT
jgi:histidinol-phosphate aminotransferase